MGSLLTRKSLLFKSPIIPAAAYTGPGDVISAAKAWWGLRAYSSAQATGTQNAVDLADQAGANAITIKIKSSGDLDVASISAWAMAHSVSTIKVTKLYDQTGNGFDLSQATLNNMPTLVLNQFGISTSLPALQFADATAAQVLQSSATMTQSQPFDFSAVFDQTGEIGFRVKLLVSASQNAFIGDGGAANTTDMNAGSDLSATASNNAIHAGNYTFNSTSSVVNVDGTETTGDAFTQGISSETLLLGGQSTGAARTWVGFACECGIWAALWTTTQRNNMRANQRLYWNTP